MTHIRVIPRPETHQRTKVNQRHKSEPALQFMSPSNRIKLRENNAYLLSTTKKPAKALRNDQKSPFRKHKLQSIGLVWDAHWQEHLYIVSLPSSHSRLGHFSILSWLQAYQMYMTNSPIWPSTNIMWMQSNLSSVMLRALFVSLEGLINACFGSSPTQGKIPF